MVHNKVTHKYLQKMFYGQTNKKKYKSYILMYNIRHINIIAIQDVILIVKLLDWSDIKKQLVADTFDIEIIQICSITNVLLKYNCHLNYTNDKGDIDLGLQNVKKYWKHAA